MCRLSIIIPMYRVESYLPACLDSVLVPGRRDYEIIAVDDGSPDRSGEIAEDYARRFPELLRVIHQENGGLGAARNTGLAAARGEFLLFLDSDDSLFPGAVEEMLEELDRDGDADVLFFSEAVVDESGRRFPGQAGALPTEPFTLASWPRLIAEQPDACTKLWRRSLFLDSGVRFPARLWFEDLATSPRLYLRAGRMRAVPRVWMRYLLRAGSITNSRDPSRNREIITVLGIVREDYRRQGAEEQYRDELELAAIKHQLLAATVRVNGIDRRSPLQAELLADMEENWPRWRENPYLPGLPARHRLLLKLIGARRWGAVHALMRANALVKRKKT